MKKIYMGIGVWMALSLAGCGAKETAGDPAETTGKLVIETASQTETSDNSEASEASETEAGQEASGNESAGETAGEDDGSISGSPAALCMEITAEHEGEWKDGKALLQASNDKIAVLDGDKDGHPELKAALDTYNKENWDSVLGVYNDTLETAREFVTPESEGWYIERKIQVSRADEAIVSLWNTETAYLGGAHGSFYMNGESFDPETGAKLELTDVVTDLDQVYEYVETYLAENYDQEMFFPDYVETSLKPMFSGEGGEGISPVEWALDQETLTFIFNPYVLGPWAAGSITVYLPFEGNEDLIEEKYRTVGPATVRAIGSNEPLKADLDGDGTEETVTFHTTPEEGGYQTGVEVSVEKNGEIRSAGESFYGYPADSWRTADAWLMTPGPEHSYLYMEFRGDNDWHHLEIFDLSGGDVKYVGFSSPAFYGHSVPGADRFWLFERLDVLGTYMAYREYTVGEDGIPAPTDEEWSLAGCAGGDAYSITSTREIPVRIDGKEETMPAGTVFTLMKTGGPAVDGKTFVEAELPDGRICRIDLTIEEDQYFFQIDGVSEYDCFESLRYAG